MPEGDTIFRTARALNKALTGQRVAGFETQYAKLASLDDQSPVAGRIVERVEARGKWCLIFFSGDLVLLTHMLMSGSWHIYRTGERWRVPHSAMRVVIRTDEFEAVAFHVPVAEFHTAAGLERHRMLPQLGPDVLAKTYAAEEVAARITEQATREIGDVLLDQRVLAGLGNVYKSEVCFASGVHPFRLVSTLLPQELAEIVARSREFITANVQDSSGDKIVTYTGMRRTTRNADTGARLWVYGRSGRPCRRCGTPILMRKQGAGARSSYWCPECQPYLDADRRPAQMEGRAASVPRRKVGCS